MTTSPGAGRAAAVVKLKVESAFGLSGGSVVSSSDTPVLETVTLHNSPGAKSTAGFTVQVVLPASAVAESACTPELAHEIEKAPAAPTGSLKVAETLASTGTAVALSAGAVDCTVGA